MGKMINGKNSKWEKCETGNSRNRKMRIGIPVSHGCEKGSPLATQLFITKIFDSIKNHIILLGLYYNI